MKIALLLQAPPEGTHRYTVRQMLRVVHVNLPGAGRQPLKVCI